MKDSLEVAKALFSKNKIVEAKPLFSSIAENEPMNVMALYHLGVCEFRLKEFEAAGEHFRKIVDLDPENVDARYYLGLTFERLGNEMFAKKHFRVALKLNPNYKPAINKLRGSDPTAQTLSRPSEATQEVGETKDQPTVKSNKVFTFDTRNGPGELIYLSPNRRLSSFNLMFSVFTLSAALTVLYTIAFFLDLWFAINEILLVSIPVLIVTGLSLYLSSRFTEYKIFERRIDIKSGILFRKQHSLWLFEVTDIKLTRNPIELLTRNTTLVLDTEKGEIPIRGLVKRRNIACGNIEFIEILFTELRAVVREQRGEIKKVWI